MRTWPTCEVDVGRALAPLLRADGFELYPEVYLPSAVGDDGEEAIPDLIAIHEQNGLCEFYELKTCVSLDLVADADRWTMVANRSWGVAPMVQKERRKAGGFVQACLAFSAAGAGLILVDERGCWEKIVYPKFRPTHRLADIGIREAILTARSGYAEAGSPGKAKRYRRKREKPPTPAPHAELEAQLRALIDKRPRISVAKALREVKAPPSFKLAVWNGRVAGIAVERNRFVLKDQAA